MSKKRPEPRRLPVKLPSVADSESPPTKYDEPDLPKAADRVPAKRIEPSYRGSRAELRLRIEELLRRKESPPESAWADLGDDARDLLVQLLDDEAIRSHDAIHHRLIAVLGELRDHRSVPGLISILADRDDAGPDGGAAHLGGGRSRLRAGERRDPGTGEPRGASEDEDSGAMDEAGSLTHRRSDTP